MGGWGGGGVSDRDVTPFRNNFSKIQNCSLICMGVKKKNDLREKKSSLSMISLKCPINLRRNLYVLRKVLKKTPSTHREKTWGLGVEGFNPECNSI